MPELMPLDKWAGSAVAVEGNPLPTGDEEQFHCVMMYTAEV